MNVQKKTIDNLLKNGQYEFTLTGQFEDVVGYHAEVKWGAATPLEDNESVDEALDDNSSSGLGSGLGSGSGSGSSPSSGTKEDPPRIFPAPPKVTIDEGTYKEESPVKVSEESDNV